MSCRHDGVMVELHEVGMSRFAGMGTTKGARRGSGTSNEVLGWIVSTCPTSSSGSDMNNVRVSGSAMAWCVNVSKDAPKSVFAWPTVVVNETQSPFGETAETWRLLAFANALNAATVALEG
jgi:hypothetical protein